MFSCCSPGRAPSHLPGCGRAQVWPAAPQRSRGEGRDQEGGQPLGYDHVLLEAERRDTDRKRENKRGREWTANCRRCVFVPCLMRFLDGSCVIFLALVFWEAVRTQKLALDQHAALKAWHQWLEDQPATKRAVALAAGAASAAAPAASGNATAAATSNNNNAGKDKKGGKEQGKKEVAPGTTSYAITLAMALSYLARLISVLTSFLIFSPRCFCEHRRGQGVHPACQARL